VLKMDVDANGTNEIGQICGFTRLANVEAAPDVTPGAAEAPGAAVAPGLAVAPATSEGVDSAAAPPEGPRAGSPGCPALVPPPPPQVASRSPHASASSGACHKTL
jgi:hypothetical protein